MTALAMSATSQIAARIGDVGQFRRFLDNEPVNVTVVLHQI